MRRRFRTASCSHPRRVVRDRLGDNTPRLAPWRALSRRLLWRSRCGSLQCPTGNTIYVTHASTGTPVADELPITSTSTISCSFFPVLDGLSTALHGHGPGPTRRMGHESAPRTGAPLTHTLDDNARGGVSPELLAPSAVADSVHGGAGIQLAADPTYSRMFFQDGLTRSAWGDWAVYTGSPPRAFESELGVQDPAVFWDAAGFTADGDTEIFARRCQTELSFGRTSTLATTVFITPNSPT